MSIMEGRLNLAVNKSCDGVEPSNVQVMLAALLQECVYGHHI